MEEGKIKVEEVVEEIVIDDSNTYGEALDFFANADEPREGFEDSDNDEEDEEGEAQEDSEEEQPTMGQTTAEDEEYFKVAMNVLDSTRAMALSVYMKGDLTEVKKFTYYKNWDDPEHQQFLLSGRVVARKYRFSAFQWMPELAIAIAIIVSSLVLFAQAKKEKKESSEKKYQPSPSKGGGAKIRPLGPITNAM